MSAGVPPGPRGLPLVGSLVPYLRDPLEFLTRSVRRHGDVVRIPPARMPLYVLSHPRDIERVLRTDAGRYRKDRFLRGTVGLLGRGLLTSEGDFWRRQRRLAQPAFHHRRIERYAEVMAGYADRLADGWRDGGEHDVHRDMMRLTLAIVAKTLFDADTTDVAARVGEAVETVSRHFRNPLGALFPVIAKMPTPGRVRYRRAIRELDTIVYAIIGERRASTHAPGDLLSMLLSAVDEDGSRMSDRQLRDEFITLFLAGHETTALALSYAFLLVAEHPAVDARLAAELDAALEGRAPTVADLDRIPYTRAVVQEAMRLYPPAWGMGREPIDDVELGGYTIPAGAQVSFFQWIVHRDPRWYDAPESFRPERWLDGLAERLPRFAYFPFGGGPRVCIGNHFATLEAVLVLAALARRFRFRVAPGHRLKLMPSITLRPERGVRLVVEPRRPAEAA